MVKEIRIYCEGDRALRPSLGSFLSGLRDKASDKGILWEIVACGSANRTFENFRDALTDHPDAWNLLLVDAEEPVVHHPWEHLRLRKQNRFQPPKIDASHCHLMVQMMEAWFIADPQLLREYYKQGFNDKVIPKASDVEQIGKEKIETSLKEATKNTTKGPYHKTRHAPDILRLLNVERVRKAAVHCDRLFRTLAEIIQPPTTPALDESPQSSGPNPT